MVSKLFLATLVASIVDVVPVSGLQTTSLHARRPQVPKITRRASSKSNDVDVIVVGSGLGGLVCAATIASYGHSVAVLEAHTEPGGAAHGFSMKAKGVDGTFHFDTGPSFFSGLTGNGGGGSSPLRDALDALGLEVPCATYNTFGLCLPEGDFVHTAKFKENVLQSVAGSSEVAAWDRLQASMKPLASAVEALPAAALRVDPGVAATTARYLPNFAAVATQPNAPLPWQMGSTMTTDFGELLDKAGLKAGFGRNWLDLLCFCLSGLPANGTVVAEMAMMMGEFYKEDNVMDYPKGGVKSIVETLVGSIEASPGCSVQCKAEVKRFVRDSSGRIIGVEVKNGDFLRAKHGVVSNAGTWATQELLQNSDDDATKSRKSNKAEAKWRVDQSTTPACNSFMHLHVGFSTAGLSAEKLAALQCHYMILSDWDKGVEAEDNAVLVSIPSTHDPSLAPEGHMVLHAYTPATENFDKWEGLKRNSPEYAQLKEERSAYLWESLERIIPDIRERAVISRVGTPLTHQRFLRKYRGTYGPAIQPSEGVFPPPTTPVPGLTMCGDATFPGIGVPAVAGSGLIAANTVLGLQALPKHLRLLDRLDARPKRA